jgi:hypothetical protein
MDLTRLTRRPAFAAVAVVTLTVIVAFSPPAMSARAHESATPMEVRWVRAHLDSVLRELPQHDVSKLSSVQLANRASVLATLRSYRDAGEFPRNYDFKDPTPYFTDRKTGTLCAVGYLLASTGRGDIVDRVTRANNNVRVRELARDTALAAWLSENGLSLDEAARIQVLYAQPAGLSGTQIRTLAYLAATPFALGGSVITGVWNAMGNSDGHRAFANTAGLVSGIASIGLGVALSQQQNLPKSSGMIMAGVGTASIALAMRSLVHRHEAIEAIHAEQKTVVIHDVQILPTIALNNGAAPGFSVSMRF